MSIRDYWPRYFYVPKAAKPSFRPLSNPLAELGLLTFQPEPEPIAPPSEADVALHELSVMLQCPAAWCAVVLRVKEMKEETK